MNISIKLPLWKTTLSDIEYIQLKELIKNNVINFRRTDQNLLNKLVALYYASWWRREYKGGKPTKETIAESIGVKEQWKVIDDMAKQGLKQLNIKIIKGPQRNLWLRTLLVQGGLPIACISSQKEQLNGFRNFLGKLIEYTSTYVVNWDNCEFIAELPFLYKLPKSFQNEEIFELCLQISKAIGEDREDLLPFDLNEREWKEITEELKIIKSKDRKQNVNLALRWYFQIHETSAIYYQVELPKNIPIGYLEEKQIICNSFQVIANNIQLATYDRGNGENFIIRQNNKKYIAWEEEPVIMLKIRTNTGHVHSFSVPNNLPPEFDKPILLVETTDYWPIQTALSNSYPNKILFNANKWRPTIDTDSVKQQTTIKFFEEEIISIIEITSEIEFQNSTTDEVLSFDFTTSNYHTEFIYSHVYWMSQTNYGIINSNPRIHVYNEDGTRLSRDYSVSYRSLESRSGITYPYNYNVDLPIGKLEFIVKYPNGRKFKTQLFNIADLKHVILSATSNECEIKFEAPAGVFINLIANQSGIDGSAVSKNHFKLKRIESGIYFPTHIKFDLAHSSGNTKFSLVAPFKGLSIFDSESNNQVKNSICLNSLYHYHIFTMGGDVTCKLYHSQNSTRVFSITLKEGVHNLSHFNSVIERLIQLNDNSVNDINSFIRIECSTSGLGRKIINIRSYNLFVEINYEEEYINVIDEGNNRAEKRTEINCICLTDAVSDLDNCCKLIRNESGFLLPDKRKVGDAYLLFSDTHLSHKISPTIINYNSLYFSYEIADFQQNKLSDLTSAEAADDNMTQSEEWQIIMQSFEMGILPDLPFTPTKEWQMIVRIFDIAAKYELPFSTFVQFKVIASSQELLVKMLYVIWYVSVIDQNSLLQQLVRFENEMGIAWHWIENKVWEDCFNDWFIKLAQEQGSIKLILVRSRTITKKRKEFLNYSLNSAKAYDTITEMHSLIEVNRLDNGIINEVRNFVDVDKNLIDCRIEIPRNWIEARVFPLAFEFGENNRFIKYHEIKTLLLSPFKAALASSGNDNSFWENIGDPTYKSMRRAVLFYRMYMPQVYWTIFEYTLLTLKKLNDN